METKKEFRPDLMIHPGEHLRRLLESVGLSQGDAATRLGISRKHLNRIIRGRENISDQIALVLERVLGTPSTFWVNLASDYELGVARKEAEVELKCSLPQLRRFPVREMVRLGWIRRSKSKIDLLDGLLAFFGVATFDALEATWTRKYSAAFRRSAGPNTSRVALGAWLRAGHVKAVSAELPPYRPARLKASISKIRQATCNLDTFRETATSILNGCGIALVFVEHLKGTYANGATYWLDELHRPVIQLSLRHKWCDVIVFTLFHELVHVLRHTHSEIFINDRNDYQAEKEADTLAAEILIPNRAFGDFVRHTPKFTADAVSQFSKGLGIHSCLVVGRLQREKYLSYSDPEFRGMKPRFVWRQSPDKVE